MKYLLLILLSPFGINAQNWTTSKQPSDTVYIKKINIRNFVRPEIANDTLYYDGVLYLNGEFYGDAKKQKIDRTNRNYNYLADNHSQNGKYDSAYGKRLFQYNVGLIDSIPSKPHQSTYQSGDLIWLTSYDTSKIKVEKVKMDTIGPQLRIVSDTAHDHWNGVSAMWVYEVRIYGDIYYAQGWLPKHFCWLDSKKKPFNLKVWEIK